MPTTYTPADDAEQIAQPLIEADHRHLIEADILWIKTSAGREKVQVLSGLLRWALSGQTSVEEGPDFLILIPNDVWLRLSRAGRRAFVDELLSQCGRETNERDEADKWIRVRPDAQVWCHNLARFGLWRAELRELGKTMAELPAQLPLVLDDEVTDADRVQAEMVAGAGLADEEPPEEDDRSGWGEDDPPPVLDNEAVRGIRRGAAARA